MKKINFVFLLCSVLTFTTFTITQAQTLYLNGHLKNQADVDAFGILSASDYDRGAFITLWSNGHTGGNAGRLIFSSGYVSDPNREAFSFLNRIGSTTGQHRADLRILQNGNILIGTPPIPAGAATYKLNVGGNVRANEVVINTTGADFVFDDTYKLKDLSEVEKFIKSNKHLPEVPSAEMMTKEGMNLSAVTTTLLQKVEELTLYLIEIKKENELIKKENELINKKLATVLSK